MTSEALTGDPVKLQTTDDRVKFRAARQSVDEARLIGAPISSAPAGGRRDLPRGTSELEPGGPFPLPY